LYNKKVKDNKNNKHKGPKDAHGKPTL